MIYPSQLFSPTTITKNHPPPVWIYVPDNKTGEGTSWDPPFYPLLSDSNSDCLFIHFSVLSFGRWSDSPVIAASSHIIPIPWSTTPSTGILTPLNIFTMSPTLKSFLWIVYSYPSLLTVT